MNQVLTVLLGCMLLGATPLAAEDTVRKALIRDVTSVEGIRENPVLGYGMVVGLRGTGDRHRLSSPPRRWPTFCSTWEYRFLQAQSRSTMSPRCLLRPAFRHSPARVRV